MCNKANEPLILARDLTRVYTMGAGEVTGINAVNLDIAAGELVVLSGNSGSGKSTLLAILAGLDQPTRGELRVGHYHLQSASPAALTRYRRQMVGMVFQSFNLLPTLTVLENVSLPALLTGRKYAGVVPQAVELLTWLQLQTRLQHLPAQLSGGEMQRTAIARALINDPTIILADEPTGNLDSLNSSIVLELLVNLNRQQGRTVIIATHSRLVDNQATVRIHLHDGVIVPNAGG
jgi:putative ABC transport system ATP-binding protein